MAEKKIVVTGEVVNESLIEDIKINRRDILDLIAEDLAEDARKRLDAFDKETEEKMPPEAGSTDYLPCAAKTVYGLKVDCAEGYGREKGTYRIEITFNVLPENLPEKTRAREAWGKLRDEQRKPLQDEYNFLTGDKKRLKNELIRRQLSESGEGQRVLGTVEEMRKKLATDLRAKRDALMLEYDRRYPGYGFARHKGYPVREHVAALNRKGPCPIHRRSFAPVRAALGLPPE